MSGNPQEIAFSCVVCFGEGIGIHAASQLGLPFYLSPYLAVLKFKMRVYPLLDIQNGQMQLFLRFVRMTGNE
jgi:hypothetical protein